MTLLSKISPQTIHLYLQNLAKNEDLPPSDITKLKAIDRVENLTYSDFFTKYMMLNMPCIITYRAAAEWKSSLEWVQDNRPNFEFFKKEFGSCQVPVSDCNVKEYNSHKKGCMSFKDYLNYWCSWKQGTDEKLLYLKDWHFTRQYPKYQAYETPEYFLSDWLNEFCENQDDDYKFVYMGPAGTCTPLHADVFGSFSWSINICGSKKWFLFPPGSENCLKDGRDLPFMVDEGFLKQKNAFYYEIIQNAQEIIFVPSGWYHQVSNMEDTISINHNWFNGCNIDYIWKCLRTATAEVENAIVDCKGSDEWNDQVQICLKAHHGMNHSDFLKMLQCISGSRMDKVDFKAEPSDWHLIFDLTSIKHLCLKIRAEVSSDLTESLEELILKIQNCLSDITIM